MCVFSPEANIGIGATLTLALQAFFMRLIHGENRRLLTDFRQLCQGVNSSSIWRLAMLDLLPRATCVTVLVLLGGCSSLPEVPPTDTGCQVRAGAAAPEGSLTFAPFGGGNVAAVGAAATVVGDCPADFRTFAKGANGSIVCYGEAEWCDKAAAAAPLEVTPAQLRSLLEGEEGAP